MNNQTARVLKRHDFASVNVKEEVPDLLEIQLASYEEFLQENVLAEKRMKKGLEAVFRSMFPVEDNHRNYVLEYKSYYLGLPKYTMKECLDRRISYSVPLKVKFVLHITNENDRTQFVQDIEQDVFFGNVPYMTDRGTFIINDIDSQEFSKCIQIIGNEGVIEPGGVQWMTAGRGIVHSEMPEQKDGLLQGFQLWVNLPASAKMTHPSYQEFVASSIPVEQIETGGEVKIISGKTDKGTQGLVVNDYTEPLYLDIRLKSRGEFCQAIPKTHSGLIYVIEGIVKVGQTNASLKAKSLGVLGDGDKIEIRSDNNSRFLVIAGKRLNETIERAGPFVMNTKEEVLQAFQDYQQGRF